MGFHAMRWHIYIEADQRPSFDQIPVTWESINLCVTIKTLWHPSINQHITAGLWLWFKMVDLQIAWVWLTDSFDSMALGWCGNNCESMIFKFITQNSSLGIHFEIALKWMPQNLANKKSYLLGAIGQHAIWRHQAINWANVDCDLYCHDLYCQWCHWATVS